MAQDPRVITTILSGDDIVKFDEILKYYSKDIAPSVSSVIRLLIKKEFDIIKK